MPSHSSKPNPDQIRLLRARARRTRMALRALRAAPSFGSLPHAIDLVLLGPQPAHTIAVEDPSAPGYGAGKLELLAKAAQLVYSDGDGFAGLREALPRQTGLAVRELTPVVTRTCEVDVQGYVATSDRMVLCVFRGTEPLSLVDWALDFEVSLEDHPLPVGGGGTFAVHRGFWNGVDAVWKEQLLPALETALLGAPDRFLYLGGHSLGGALAMVAAARLPDGLRQRLRGVYTLGQPRVGGAGFAAAYDEDLGDRTFRLVNGEDLVPQVPLEPMGYEHAGQERRCCIGPEVMLHLDWGEHVLLKRLHDLAYRCLPEFVHDHLPEAYVRGAPSAG